MLSFKRDGEGLYEALLVDKCTDNVICRWYVKEITEGTKGEYRKACVECVSL